MSETETLENPAVIHGIPSTYGFTARPKPARGRQATTDPKLVADLQDTLRSGEAMCWPVDGYPELQVRRLASRLTNVGRRGHGFTVRTRRADGHLYAWAVLRSPEAPRPRRAKQTALPTTTTTTAGVGR